jgi:hypothetical protein
MELKKNIVIFKNDRGGDLFISLKLISSLRNEFNNITIFLSELNYGFRFLFEKFNTKKINYNLSIINKLQIFFFLLKSNTEEVYILAPKNFYFYLPLFFKKIKFYGVTINGNKRNRPPIYLRKYLKNFVEISRHKKRNSKPSRDLQMDLLDKNIEVDYLFKNLSISKITELQKNQNYRGCQNCINCQTYYERYKF